jgi:hypothetical protein
MLCAAGGLLAGTLASREATNKSWELLPLAALVAALLTGAAVWRLLVQRAPGPGRWRPLLAGALTGAAAHYTCWYLLFLSANVCTLFSDACLSSLGERPLDPLNALWGSAVFSAVSLAFFGWLTVPLGALLGWAYGRRQASRAAAAALSRP